MSHHSYRGITVTYMYAIAKCLEKAVLPGILYVLEDRGFPHHSSHIFEIYPVLMVRFHLYMSR